ncbi:hypothetical protein [Nonomuraea sp. NPDC046570]|uniref:hypothetical protein n=1 Tax=Nonomuraea sp. NPDC046570 TaxID=3155255 RepID=UPI0034040A14
MTRDVAQGGRPFEPHTFGTKSDLRSSGRIALPLVSPRGDDVAWLAKWLHLHLSSLLRAKSSSAEETTYIGLEAPTDLPERARVYPLATLHELIPA